MVRRIRALKYGPAREKQMPQDDKPLGAAHAGAQLAVVRSTVSVVVQTLIVMMATFFAVGVFLNILGVKEGGIREWYEILLTCVISLAALYQTTLRPLTRLAAEHAAASAESRFWAVAQSTVDGIVMFDADKRILFANKAAERMFGYQAGSLQGQCMEILLPEDLKQAFAESVETFLRTKQSMIIGKGPTERAGLRTNGERFPMEISVSELVADSGIQFVVVVRDISARKNAEHEIQERTTRLNALLANSPLGMVVLDKNHRVQMCNPAFEELFQYKSAEIAGLELDGLVASVELKEEASEMTESNLQGKVSHAITRRRRKDGSLVDVEVHGVPLLIGGQLEGAYAIYQDVSERKTLKLYEQLLPVCCVCGKIRDDQGRAPGQGPWDRLDRYIASHSDAKLTHTFCPECLAQYRKDQGI
jgi:PAS domain S-box-containing protein